MSIDRVEGWCCSTHGDVGNEVVTFDLKGSSRRTFCLQCIVDRLAEQIGSEVLPIGPNPIENAPAAAAEMVRP